MFKGLYGVYHPVTAPSIDFKPTAPPQWTVSVTPDTAASISKQIRSDKQRHLDDVFSKVAITLANDLSKCVSKKVAAVAVINGNIICTGINGTAPGDENCCDHFHHQDMSALPVGDPQREAHSAWSNQHEGHAELNLIAKAARDGVSLYGATLYCTLQPCWGCSKYLKMAGIARIVYTSKYDRVADTDNATIEYFAKRNIEVVYHQLEGQS